MKDADAAAPFTEDFRERVLAERERLGRELAALQDQATELRERADAVEERAAPLARAIDELGTLLGLAPQLRLDACELRGRELRDAAIEVLRDLGPGREVHYRDWADLVAERTGRRIAGKVPADTLRVQISRSDEVQSVGRRSGTYRLRAA
jgi:hypothetical protein